MMPLTGVSYFNVYKSLTNFSIRNITVERSISPHEHPLRKDGIPFQTVSDEAKIKKLHSRNWTKSAKKSSITGVQKCLKKYFENKPLGKDSNFIAFLKSYSEKNFLNLFKFASRTSKKLTHEAFIKKSFADVVACSYRTSLYVSDPGTIFDEKLLKENFLNKYRQELKETSHFPNNQLERE